ADTPTKSQIFRGRLTEIIPEAREVKTFRFAPEGGVSITHLPGQFMHIGVPIPDGDRPQTRRSFTISSAPTETGRLQITVKRNPAGTVSNFLHQQARVGDTFDLRAPFGRFTFTDGRASRILCIGGGSGVTPLRAILRYICDRRAPVEVVHLDFNRREEDIIFRREFQGMPASHPGIRVHFALTDPGPAWQGLVGRIGADLVDQTLKGFEPEIVYLCGPPPMMDVAKQLLLARGLRPDQIVTESFG
ncbi:MAG TPA: FAD-binding oxidoreductase, partial [Candidatus Methylomirabilis sp.]|nr:FAD-binding oxidoreductase [Candidatus Methylomirabilis sp.]